MNMGGGLRVMLSVNKDAPHQAIHPGETIGQFKLVDVNTEEMTFGMGRPDDPQESGRTDRLRLRRAEAAAARVEAPHGAAPPPPAVKSGPGEDTAVRVQDLRRERRERGRHGGGGVSEDDVHDAFRAVLPVGAGGEMRTKFMKLAKCFVIGFQL